MYWIMQESGGVTVFQCDTSLDISGLPNQKYAGDEDTALFKEAANKCGVGSMCVCVQNGNVYMLDSNGNWYDTASGEVSASGGASSLDIEVIAASIETGLYTDCLSDENYIYTTTDTQEVYVL